MKVQIDRELRNNSYNAKISIIEENVGNYAEAVHDFGETAINFGGQIFDEDGTTVLATIADRTLKVTDIIKTPMTQSFATNQYGDKAEKTANQWISASVKKIEDYVKEMCAKIDTFTGTQIVDV